MKRWRCIVCNYIHVGDSPPDKCPICGVGPEKFVLLEEKAEKKPARLIEEEKKWRCVVCNHIHTGDSPPDICPICGVGPEKFILVEDLLDDMPDQKREAIQQLLFGISDGLYVVSSKKGERYNAMISNTFIQVTNMPLRASVCIGKDSLTAEYILDSGVLGVSILGKENHDLVKHFGYQSGRDLDKFNNMSYITGKNTSCPGLPDALSFVECEVEQTIDLGSHYLFIAKVLEGEGFSHDQPMTYAYYREIHYK